MPPAVSPLVLFDISALGLWSSGTHNRRGVFRVVERLLDALSVQCQMEFSATENSHLARRYLALRSELASIPFHSGGVIHEWLGPLSDAAESYLVKNAQDVATNRSLHRRISRRGALEAAIIVGNLLRKTSRLDYGEAHIFHQPAMFPLPARKAGKAGPSRMMTIYDFIPLQDATVGPEQKAYFTKVFSSLMPDDFAICISSYVQEEAKELLKLPADRIFVAPLAADPETFHPNVRNEERAELRELLGLGDTPYFLTLSALDPRKNINFLVQCFADLCKQNSSLEVNLVLAGSVAASTRALLEKEARAMGIGDRLIILGFVPDHLIAALYSEALAFVFPSLSEGFGLPPLEAMRCGTPVISSNTTSLPEVVGGAGILANPRDRDEFASAMIRIILEPELRADLTAKGLERSALFSWDKCAEAHLEAYRIANS